MILVSVLVVFFDRKKAICIVLSLLLAVALTGCKKEDTSVKTYEAFAVENGVMPTLDALGEYQSVKTLMFETFEFVPAYTLIAEYDAEHFGEAVKAVEERYTFQKEPMTDKVEENTLEPTFSLDGYDFRVLDLAKYSQEYSEFPEEIYFIGLNGQERKIAYVYFYDQSLDVGDSLEYILTRYCDWGAIK